MPAGELKHLKGQINLNEATEEQLASVPVIGSEQAHSIVEYRKEHGPFERLDDLARVPGVGPELVSTLRQALSVEGRRLD